MKAAILSNDKWENPAYKLDVLNEPHQVTATNNWCSAARAAEFAGVHVHTGFLGIHNRIFSPQSFDLGFQNTQSHGEARFGSNDVYFVKLHGSLTWRKCGELDYRELAAREAWTELKEIVEGKKEPDDSIMVFPRAAKYIQTTGYHAGELFRRFF